MQVGYAVSCLERYDMLWEVDQIAAVAYIVLQRFHIPAVEAYEIVLEAKGLG